MNARGWRVLFLMGFFLLSATLIAVVGTDNLFEILGYAAILTLGPAVMVGLWSLVNWWFPHESLARRALGFLGIYLGCGLAFVPFVWDIYGGRLHPETFSMILFVVLGWPLMGPWLASCSLSPSCPN